MALISPLMAVLLMAPAKVRQGKVRLHGLTSSPTPETQVRVACALAADAAESTKARAARGSSSFLTLFISYLLGGANNCGRGGRGSETSRLWEDGGVKRISW